MVNNILFVPFLASFFITLFLIPYWIRKAHQIGLEWEDMNKLSGEKVAGSGGIIVIGGFIIGVLLYIAFIIFFLKSDNSHLIEVLTLLNVILLLAGIGFIDDLFGWQRGGLSRRTRIILIFFSSIPLIVINAGKSMMSFPFFGVVDLGILYPLIIIPIGVIGATTTFNFLAGYNGLEAGQGVILLSGVGLMAFLTGNSWLAVIVLCMILSLVAFLFYNYYPARVFPGDSLTYAVGGLIAVIAILGNFEKIAIFFFIPYAIESILKIRGKLVKQSFGKPKEGGTLDLKYNKIYGLEHAAIWLMQLCRIKSTEKRVIFVIWTFQILVIISGFIIFKEGIFK